MAALEAGLEEARKGRVRSPLLTGRALTGLFFGFSVIFLNLHLFGFEITPQVFLPDRVLHGEYWRILTHPIVHMSWLHLGLDLLAFYLLWDLLMAKSIGEKLAYVGITALFSLGGAFFHTELIGTTGFSGLSGIDHGLIMILVLQQMRHGETKSFQKQARCTMWFLILKCIYEIATGNLLFNIIYHIPGVPLLISHAGGLAGGFVAYHLFKKRHISEVNQEETVQ